MGNLVRRVRGIVHWKMNAAVRGGTRQKPVAVRGKRRGASTSSSGGSRASDGGSVSDVGKPDESKSVASTATQDADEKHSSVEVSVTDKTEKSNGSVDILVSFVL